MKFKPILAALAVCLPCFLLSVSGAEAKAPMEYYQAVSRLVSAQEVKTAPAPKASGSDGESPYALARLLIETSDELAISLLSGVDQVAADGIGHYVVQFDSPGSARLADEILQKDSSVISSEPDRTLTLEAEPVFPTIAPLSVAAHNSWGIDHIGADAFADYAKTCSQREILVAVVDSGIDESHPYFEGRIAAGAYDFVENDASPQDGFGHGTFVSGIVVDAALSLPNIKVLPVRVFDANGSTTMSNLCSGIRYAADEGAAVINCSFGLTDGKHSTELHNAIDYATEKGCLVVASSGNSNKAVFCPADYDGAVVSVGSVDDSETRVSSSNYGDSLDVCAPGDRILGCAVGGGYKTGGGTSYAAPHVSACAAMLRLANPSFSRQDVMDALVESCRDLGDVGWDTYYGWGIVDLSTLLSKITCRYEEETHTITVTSPILDSQTLYIAEYSEQGKMMGIHNITQEAPSLPLLPAVSTVKLFLMENPLIVVASEVISVPIVSP